MTVEQAMATVAVEVYGQHVSDHRYHASLGGSPCSLCKRLGEAAATLQQEATKSVGLTDIRRYGGAR
jgi:hypothetical protein